MALSEDFYVEKWNGSGIPIKYQGLRIADYENEHESGKIAARAAQKFVDEFEDHYVSQRRARTGDLPEFRHNIGKGLLFTGQNGTRKTTLACAILTEIQYLDNRYDIVYMRASGWLKAHYDTFSDKPEPTRNRGREILKRAMNATLFVLDDLGQEHSPSGFMSAEVHEMLRMRHEKARPTIVTTNVSLARMEEVYGKSFNSFRHDAFDAHMIVGNDTRKN